MLTFFAAFFIFSQTSAPASRPASILDVCIEAARRDHPNVDADAVRRAIGDLADKVRARAGADATPETRCEALRAALFDDAKFEAVSDLDSPETLHLDSVLRTKKGYCLSLSLAALAVAERAGLGVHGVAAPNHFFIRFEEGSFRRNLEMTRRGAAVDDEEYKKRMGGVWRAGSAFLRDLAAAEVEAVLLHNRGFVAMQQRRTADARADFEAALALLPGLADAHRNLGVLHGEAKRWPDAIASFTRAVDLWPADADALLNRALCRNESGDLAGAVTDADAALLVDPGRDRARRLSVQWSAELRAHDWRAWQKISVRPLKDAPPALEPGLVGTYYSGADFDRLALTRVDRDVDFDWKSGSPARGVPADRFSVRWEGFLRIDKAADYSIFAVSNDGVRVVLDDRAWIDHWEIAGRQNYYGSAEMWLAEGWHRVRVEMFEDTGGARMLLRLGADGSAPTLDLADHLFHARDAAK